MTQNDIEITFNNQKITLRQKTTASLCSLWKNLQKPSKFLSSNSCKSLVIAEKPVENIKNDQKLPWNDH